MNDNKPEPIECNLPFERFPVCACDAGFGPKPSRAKGMRCWLSGGPCSPGYYERHPEEVPPVAYNILDT